MANIRLLIVDDELGFYRTFREKHQARYDFTTYSNADKGLEAIRTSNFDAVILDLRFEGEYSFEDGLSQLVPKAAIYAKGRFPIIVATSDNRKDTRQIAIQNGAHTLLRKNEYAVDLWEKEIRKAIGEFQIPTIGSVVKNNPGKNPNEDGFIAISTAMIDIKKRLRALVNYQDKPVLITGETGVGKEIAAKFIHQSKNDETLKFEPVNLAALSENIVQSEVFGHAKGAFTDAKEDKVGYFESVTNGTLFLDEIGEINPDLQVKLLRVLEEKKFQPVGSTRFIPLQAHLVFGTNKDLEEAIDTGEFRRDFYERISAIQIHIPPLRERPEEIMPLIKHFIHQLCKPTHPYFGYAVEDCFTPQALEKLCAYDWPSNIRQLRNMIDNLLFEADVQGKPKIDEHLLPLRFKKTFSGHGRLPVPEPDNSLASSNTHQLNWSVAKQNAYNTLGSIEKALRQAAGRKEEAAVALGMENDQNLRYRVLANHKKYPELFVEETFPTIIKVYKLQ
jgi:DNA-binding NtrC family response regulator